MVAHQPYAEVYVPIPENIARVHMNFDIGGGEIAVGTYAMQVQHGAGNTLSWPDAVNTLANKAYTKWASAMATQATKFGPQVALSNVAVYHLDATTGHTLDKGVYAPTTAWKGNGGAGSLPQEVALAVSFYAYPPGQFVPNRARRRGRMFLPPLDASTVTALNDPNRAGRMSLGQRDQLATALGAYFNDMHHTSIDSSDNPLGGQDWWSFGVLSRADSAFHRVEAIRLGDVYDAQTRRRNKLREDYKDVTISDG